MSGNNRLLLVGVTLWPGIPNRYVTSVTWNGTALTKITNISYSDAIRTELWQLVAPATGSSNVVVNVTGTAPNYDANMTVGVISFTGVDQSTPYRTPATTASGSSASASVTVGSASGEMVLSVAGAGTSNRNFTSITGGTERWNLSAATYPKGAGGTAPGASSVTISHGLSSADSWAIIGLAIKPGTVTAATFALAEDSKLGIAKTTPKRLRFLVSNTGTGSSAAAYQLQAAETATCGVGHLQRRAYRLDRPLAGHGHYLFHAMGLPAPTCPPA